MPHSYFLNALVVNYNTGGLLLLFLTREQGKSDGDGSCAFPHCHQSHITVKKDTAGEGRGQNEEAGELQSRLHPAARWGGQELPGGSSQKQPEIVQRLTQSRAGASALKKQCQLEKHNQNSTECCDTQAGKQAHYLMHMFGNCFRGSFSGGRYSLFLVLI